MRASLIPCPGTVQIADVGTGPIRSMIIHRGDLYAISGNDFYKITKDALGVFSGEQFNIDVAAAVDDLTTSLGPVRMASSGQAGKQVVTVDGERVYVFEDTALVTNITAVTLANPGVVTAAGHGLANGDEIRTVQTGTKATNSITAITQANPGVVSLVAHGYSNGDEVWLEDTTGMPEADELTVTVANQTANTFEILDTSGFTAAATAGEAYKGMREINGNDYIVTAVSGTDTFSLLGIDTSGFSIYTSGGTATRHRWSSPGFSTNTGDNTFADFSSETNDIGSHAWTNPANAISSNNTDATTSNIGQTSESLTDSASQSNQGVGSGRRWMNPTNAQTSNDSDAQATANVLGTEDLYCHNFTFTIPSTATISGITVTVEGNTDIIATMHAQLINGSGAEFGAEKSQTWSTSTDTTHTFGGSADLWSTGGISESTAEDTQFGVFIRGTNSQTTTYNVDNVKMNVHYYEDTQFLRAINRSGSNLDADDVITGIEVDVEWGSTTGGQAADSEVNLVISGGAVGDNKATFATFPVADTVRTYGGAGDLWGLNAGDLPESVTSSEGFGVQVSARDRVTGQEDPTVDFINIKLYYDSAGAVAPTHIEYFDDYFIANNVGTGDFYFTANGAQLWDNSLDTATAQRDPDNIKALIKKDREVWMLGGLSGEAWYDSGDSVPFDPIDGLFTEVGIAASYSAARYSDGIVYVGQDERGAGRVIQISGQGMSTISTPQIETTLGKFPVSEAEAFTYYQDGHEFYVLTLPTPRLTLVYDFSTQSWHKRMTTDEGGRHISSCHQYWPAENLHVIGSYLDGKIYSWRTDLYQDEGKIIKRERTSASIHSKLIPGPPQGSRVALIYHWVEIDCTRGRTPIDEDIDEAVRARIRLEWSDDGGATYNNNREFDQSLLQVGDNFKIKFHALGRSYDRRFRIITEANQYVAVTDAYASVSPCIW